MDIFTKVVKDHFGDLWVIVYEFRKLRTPVFCIPDYEFRKLIKKYEEEKLKVQLCPHHDNEDCPLRNEK